MATLAAHDLDALWRQVETPVQAREALTEVLPALVDVYGAGAAALAADWYDDLRDEREVRGRFTAIPAELNRTGTDALAGWGVGPLFAANPDWAAAAVLVAGGLQRRIANAARETIIESSLSDPGADGWQRYGVGSSCGFCRMLINRGAVYSDRTASFGAHDKCNCAATVAWSDQPRPVQPYKASQRDIPQTDRDRAREWIKDNL